MNVTQTDVSFRDIHSFSDLSQYRSVKFFRFLKGRLILPFRFQSTTTPQCPKTPKPKDPKANVGGVVIEKMILGYDSALVIAIYV